MKILKNYLADFFSLFYPEPCLACGTALVSNEEFVCTFCLFHLPLTGYHMEDKNKMTRNFWGRIQLGHAASWLHFTKGGRAQQLLHQLKYKGQKELGKWIGEYYGKQLRADNAFNDADLIIPVPLHKRKYRKRGYNQSEWFAKGLALSLNVPCHSGLLVRTNSAVSQTRKMRYERYETSLGLFNAAIPAELKGKHVLLVDDVVTTGATLEACARALQESGDMKISILTIASTV